MDRFHSWLLWLDADRSRFWIVAWSAFLFTLGTALFAPAKPQPSGRTGGWISRGLFVFGVFFTLAAFRWPTWFVPTEFNPDESQMLAGAITLRRFPVYWEFVDGTTHGPACEYLLVAASWLGAPLNYCTARIVAWLLQAGALLGVWGVLRCFASERIARLAVLPGLAFWAFVSWGDFTHYSSELAGIFLLSMGTWGIACALGTVKPARQPALLLWLAGLALGAVPLGKLQSAPQAAAVAAVAIGALWFSLVNQRPLFFRRVIWLIAGGITIPCLVFLFLVVHGLRHEFWASYIESNLRYAGMGQHPLIEMPGWFLHFSVTSTAFAWFLLGSVGFALLYLASPGERPVALRVGTLVSWILLGVAYFCVIRPSREVAHYLHLMVIPATTLVGFVLAGAAVARSGEARAPSFRWPPVLWFGLFALVPQAYDRASTWHHYLGQLGSYDLRPLSDSATIIRDRGHPGDTMAMWGWEPALYVETGLPQGTHDAHSSYQLMPTPLQSFYVERYLADMRRLQPTWFVDAVGPGGFIYEDRNSFAHETIPALRDLVAQDYELLIELDNKRIYLRKKAAKN